MSRVEHYFENYLEFGRDVEGDPNKTMLSQEVIDAIEECADYIKSMYPWIKDKIEDKHNVNLSCKNCRWWLEPDVVLRRCKYCYNMDEYEEENEQRQAEREDEND